MGLKKTYYLLCDKCEGRAGGFLHIGKLRLPHRNKQGLLLAAKDNGWHIKGKKVLCPSCKPKREVK